MLTHGHGDEAEQTVEDIEKQVRAQGYELSEVADDKAISVVEGNHDSFLTIVKVFFQKYPRRTLVAFVMMVTQSFLYNAIFFSYALVLENFYGTSPSSTQYFFFPFAIGNLIGPLVLGPLFDTIGRRKMIFGTYALAGIVLAVSAVFFNLGLLNALTQTIFWCVAFFFASAGASSAYLTVSETFPLELRGQAISYFFAIGQIAGAMGPITFGILVGNGKNPTALTYGYYGAAAIMIIGGVIALIFAFDAERKSLEDITDPLSKAS